MEDDDRNITWRRTFPECAPGTDGVALFEGRAIGRVRLLAEPREKPWMWSVTDCPPPTGHGAPDRTLAGAAPAQTDLKGAPPSVAGRPASALLGREAVTPHGPKPRTRALGSQGASSRRKDIRAEVRPGGRVVLSGG